MGVTFRTIKVTPNVYYGKGDYPSGPKPVDASLEAGEEYLVLSLSPTNMNPDEEMGVTLVNSRGEIWTLSNRHLRVSSIYEGDKLIYSLPGFTSGGS
jgi:hypothetical protein